MLFNVEAKIFQFIFLIRNLMEFVFANSALHESLSSWWTLNVDNQISRCYIYVPKRKSTPSKCWHRQNQWRICWTAIKHTFSIRSAKRFFFFKDENSFIILVQRFVYDIPFSTSVYLKIYQNIMRLTKSRCLYKCVTNAPCASVITM